jgi:hypothetical protein
MAIFTFILAIVSGSTLWVLKNQLREMHDSGVDTRNLAKEATRQANIGETSIHTIQDSMRLDQRAWLSITQLAPHSNPGSAAKQFYVALSVTNTGRTPARNVGTRWFDCLDCRTSDIRYSRRSVDKAGALPPVISPGSQPGSSMNDGLQFPAIGIAFFGATTLSEDYWQRFTAGRTSPIMSGEIAYDDIFNSHHVTRFCLILRPNERWIYCKSNNYAD